MSGINKCMLFDGIAVRGLTQTLALMGAHQRLYANGDIILHQSEHTDKLGIIDFGSAEALVYGKGGDAALVSHLNEGDVFADFLATDDSFSSPVTLIACENTRVLYLPVASILSPPREAESNGKLMLSNLVRIYARKYFELKNRIVCIKKPTLREKILAVLSLYSDGNAEILLPYNRDALARYLNADRSASSRELSAMKSEGLIDYNKNRFTVISAEILEI